jgi:hypothetical protein
VTIKTPSGAGNDGGSKGGQSNGGADSGHDDGGTDDGGGDGGTGDDGGTGNDGGGKQTYTAQEYTAAQRDLHRFKEKARKAEADIATLRNQIAALEAKGQSTGSAEEQLAAARKRAEEAEARTASLESSVTEGRRLQALLPALQKLGFRDDAQELLDMVDLNEIEIESTSKGRWTAHGVDAVARSVKERFPYAFGGGKVTGLNGGTAGGGSGGKGDGGTWTAQRVNELEVKLKREGKYHTPEGKAQYAAAVKSYMDQKAASS